MSRSPYFDALASASSISHGEVQQRKDAIKHAEVISRDEMQRRARADKSPGGTDRVAVEESDGSEMQATIVKVVALPQVGAREPIAIARATNKPCRILVKNLSATTINLGFSPQDIQGPSGLGSDIWVLLPGDQDTLVAAPGQVLYGNGAAPDAQVCVSVSEAFPYL
jgi:hypothetical protein